MSDCIFCKIVNKEIPASLIYEDKSVLVFKDIHPKAPVHVLIVPKKHVESLQKVDKSDMDLLGLLMLTVKSVTEELGIAGSGYKVVINNGEGSGQLVFHLHLHVLGGWERKPQWEV